MNVGSACPPSAHIGQASKRRAHSKWRIIPTLYDVNSCSRTAPFLVIPEVSSERREYVPIGWLEPPVIPSNKVRVLAKCHP